MLKLSLAFVFIVSLFTSTSLAQTLHTLIVTPQGHSGPSPVDAKKYKISISYEATQPNEKGVKIKKYSRGGNLPIVGGMKWTAPETLFRDYYGTSTQIPNEISFTFPVELDGPGKYKPSRFSIRIIDAKGNETTITPDISASYEKGLQQVLVRNTRGPSHYMTVKIQSTQLYLYAEDTQNFEASRENIWAKAIPAKDGSLLINPLVLEGIPSFNEHSIYGDANPQVEKAIRENFKDGEDIDIRSKKIPSGVRYLSIDATFRPPKNKFRIEHLMFGTYKGYRYYRINIMTAKSQETQELVVDSKNTAKVYFYWNRKSDRDDKKRIAWFSGLEKSYPANSRPPTANEVKVITKKYKYIMDELEKSF